MKFYLIYILLLFSFSEAYGQKNFLKSCRTLDPMNASRNSDIEWLKHLYKTDDCNKIAENLKKIKSFNEIAFRWNSKFSDPETNWFSELPYPQIKFEVMASSVSYLAKKNGVFFSYNFKLYEEFQNIAHFDISNLERNTLGGICSLLRSFPNIQYLTIGYGDFDIKSDECISRSQIKGLVFINGFKTLDFVPSSKIIGIHHFDGPIKDLITLKYLRFLSIFDKNQLNDDTHSNGGLESLKYVRNLTHLKINGIHLRNADGVGTLENLKWLSISCLSIEELTDRTDCAERPYFFDLNFLSKLTLLKYLSISDSNLDALTLPQSLQSLENLSLRNNRIKLLLGIGEFVNLKQLNLSGNNLTDITPLRSLKNLTYLNLAGNYLSNFSTLVELKGLLAINLDQNIFQEDLKLELPAGVIALSLNGAKNTDDNRYLKESFQADLLTDINPVDRNIFLEWFGGDFFRVRDPMHLNVTYPFILPSVNLDKLQGLKFISMRRNNLKNLPDLSQLKKLIFVDVSENDLSKLPLLNLPELKIFRSSRNNFVAFPDLSQFPKLAWAMFRENQIQDITLLNLLPISMNGIDLSQNLLQDFSILGSSKFRQMNLNIMGNDIDKAIEDRKCPRGDVNYVLDFVCRP